MSKAARMLVYFTMLLLAVLYFSMFAYYATEEDPFMNSGRTESWATP